MWQLMEVHPMTAEVKGKFMTTVKGMLKLVNRWIPRFGHRAVHHIPEQEKLWSRGGASQPVSLQPRIFVHTESPISLSGTGALNV
jgi:hypothetical protein